MGLNVWDDDGDASELGDGVERAGNEAMLEAVEQFFDIFVAPAFKLSQKQGDALDVPCDQFGDGFLGLCGVDLDFAEVAKECRRFFESTPFEGHKEAAIVESPVEVMGAATGFNVVLLEVDGHTGGFFFGQDAQSVGHAFDKGVNGQDKGFGIVGEDVDVADTHRDIRIKLFLKVLGDAFLVIGGSKLFDVLEGGPFADLEIEVLGALHPWFLSVGEALRG